jgi:hypothetical protein
VKLYSGMVIIETNVFLSHGKFLNLFQLEGKQDPHYSGDGGKMIRDPQFILNNSSDKNGNLTQQFKFEHEIRFLFKRHLQAAKGKKATKNAIKTVGVLLANNEIHYLTRDDSQPTGGKGKKKKDTNSDSKWVSKKYGGLEIPQFPENSEVKECMPDRCFYKINMFLVDVEKVEEIEEENAAGDD